jgi:hypothetical protein
MNQKLALQCCLGKLSKVENFEKLLTEIRHINNLVRAEKAKFESLARATCETTRHTNTLAELSHCVNAHSIPVAPTTSDSYIVLLKLLETGHHLLYNNNGCLKCHHVYIDHHSTNCPNNFPNPSIYKTLTQVVLPQPACSL